MMLRPLVRRALPLALVALAACRGGTEPLRVPPEVLGRYVLVSTETPGRTDDPSLGASGYIELGPAQRATRVVTYPAYRMRPPVTETDTGRVVVARDGRLSLALVSSFEREDARCCLLMDVEYTPGQLVLRLRTPPTGRSSRRTAGRRRVRRGRGPDPGGPTPLF
jgi:hypothetical protein